MLRLMTCLASCLLINGIAMPLSGIEPPRAPQLVLDPGFHTAAITHLAVSADGTRLLSAGNDKTARVFDTQHGLLRVLRVPRGEGHEGKLNACALSANGEIAALGGYTGVEFETNSCIYFFNTATGEMSGRAYDLPGVVTQIAFAPPPGKGQSQVLLALACGEGSLRVLDLATNDEIFRDDGYRGRTLALGFSPDGRYLATACWDGTIRLYRVDIRTIAPVATLGTKSGRKPCSLALTTPGTNARGLLAVGYADGTKIDVHRYGIRAGKYLLEHAWLPDTNDIHEGCFNSVAFWPQPGSREPRLVAGGMFRIGNHHPLLVWNEAGQGKRRTLATGARTTIMDLATLPDGRLFAAAYDPALVIYDQKEKFLEAELPRIADFRGIPGRLRLSTDGSSFNYAYLYGDANAVSFSFATRAQDAALALPATDTTSIAVSEWAHTMSPSLNGQPLKLEDSEMSRTLAIAPDKKSFILGATWSLRRFTASGRELWKAATPGETWDVAISGNGKLVAAAFSDGTIRWYRMDTGAHVLTFFPHADRRRWVAWTPSGYYAASAGGDEFLRWHLNNNIDEAPDSFSVSRLKKEFYKPNIFRHIFATLDEGKALSLATGGGKPLALTSLRSMIPPAVALLGPQGGARHADGTTAFAYKIRFSSGKKLRALRFMVDGRPVLIQETNLPEKGGIHAAKIALPSRSSTVSLITEDNDGICSEEARYFHTPAAMNPVRTGGDLYILAIGISDYQDDRLNLAYAAKDAGDFARQFAVQRGRIYREIRTKLLTDTAATRTNVAAALGWLQTNVRGEDTALVFFAGHGQGAENGAYYLITHGAHPEDFEQSGLPVEVLRQSIARIRGRVAVLIDACFSGSSTGEWAAPDVDASVNDLSAPSVGAIVFASSTGDQQSLEHERWGNGLFTRALLEALAGKAARSDDGSVYLANAHAFLQRRMPELIADAYGTTIRPSDSKRRSVKENGMLAGKTRIAIRQTPVLVIPGNASDLPLAR